MTRRPTKNSDYFVNTALFTHIPKYIALFSLILFCWLQVNPICPGIFLFDHALEGMFDTVILCNVTKKMVEKISKIAAAGMMTSPIIPFFWKIMRKMAKMSFFSKINIVTARKKIFKIFFQLSKVKITYKLNI